MGLDQYLYCNSKRVCEDVHANEEDAEWLTRHGIAIKWRKANAVHGWFVQNVQKGHDDCGIYEVDVMDLVTLHDTCREILDSTRLVDGQIQNGSMCENGEWVPNMVEGKKLEDPTVAKELMPTCDGFFFGSQGYDDWYWQDLEHTVEAIESVLDTLEPTADLGWNVVHRDEPNWLVRFYYSSSW